MSGIFGAGQLQFLGGEDAFYGFEITNSLRFDGSAYLTRTLGSAGNRKTYTLSVWVKRWKFDGEQFFYCSGGSDLNNFGGPEFIGNTIGFQNYNSGTQVVSLSTELFRDPAAWYNIVYAVDTTQGTLADRLKVYVNGSQLSGFVMTDTDFSPNYEGQINTNGQVHNIGARHPTPSGGTGHFYLAEYNFIDGTALTPSSFGETKEGIWIPRDTSGLTFGTQGFRLQFKNSSVGSASSSTVGADTSGNNHHFSSINIATTDNMTDSPTDNFCTMNPLSNGDATYSDGNLKVDTNLAGGIFAQGTIAIPKTGKWYFEASVQDNSNAIFGIAELNNPFGSGYKYIAYNFAGQKEVDGAAAASYGDAYANGDFVAIGINADDNEVTFFKNGVSQGAISYTMDSTKDYLADLRDGSGGTRAIFTFNFGQQPFTYTPPTGYLALSTANLPDPAIDPAKGENPEDYFNTVLYTGTSDDSAKVITGVGFQPDFIWSKGRSGTYAARNHFLRDAVRGANKNLHSNTTDAEATDSGNSFDVDGVTLSSDYGQNGLNTNHVLWSWKAGTSFSNDASATGVGTIDSTGSVSTEAGFSIISYTGTGSSGTIAHGLGVAPSWFFVKNRTDGDASGNTAGNWIVYHQSLSTNQWLKLETTDSVFTNADAFGGSPSSTTIQLGTFNSTNGSGDNMICYAFSEKEGYSKFGSYTGNGSTDGPFIFTNFRPSFLIVRRTDDANNWIMLDSERDTHNLANTSLLADRDLAEADYGVDFDLLSNGFKLRSGGTPENASGGTYIYMAFAEQPFRFSNAR